MLYLAAMLLIVAVLHYLNGWAERRHAATRARDLANVGLVVRLQSEQGRHDALMERMLAAHRDEVQALCQRLQAPEIAVMERQLQTMQPDQSGQPMADDEVAKEQAAAVFARIAEIERAEPFAYHGEPFNGGQPVDGAES